MSLLLDPRLKNCRCIFFDELKLSASIGIHPEEKLKKQLLNINLEVYINESDSSSLNDNIKDVLDYDLIREGIIKIVNKHYQLVTNYKDVFFFIKIVIAFKNCIPASYKTI